MRACIDHLEKTGRIGAKYGLPMIEGEQWEMDGGREDGGKR